jgi:hypothetical protein
VGLSHIQTNRHKKRRRSSRSRKRTIGRQEEEMGKDKKKTK